MYTFSQRMLGNVEQIRMALKCEPGIRPNFARADIRTIIQIIFAAMMNGSFDGAAIYRYLEARGCTFDRETIDFLLNAYEGTDPEQHLWERRSLGDFQPLTAAIPAWD